MMMGGISDKIDEHERLWLEEGMDMAAKVGGAQNIKVAWLLDGDRPCITPAQMRELVEVADFSSAAPSGCFPIHQV
jgi:hypothetical protein